MLFIDEFGTMSNIWGEWLSGLRRQNQDRKLSGLNPTEHGWAEGYNLITRFQMTFGSSYIIDRNDEYRLSEAVLAKLAQR